jgi:hypothetical protein
MEDAAKKKESKVKKGEELLAVLTEILNDNAKMLELLESLKAMLVRALPPSPGRFTRL